jgi:hypothetical protein
MGFTDILPESDELPVFYNVTHAVGQNAPNVPNDVKLVQYLLMAYYEKAGNPPPGKMSVSGYCEPVTMRWILDFQMRLNKSFPNGVLLDGRIDRVRNNSIITSISKTQYTLVCLNNSVKFRNPYAFVKLPLFIPLENPLNVPPPSWDMVNQQSGGRIPAGHVPASGGM